MLKCHHLPDVAVETFIKSNDALSLIDPICLQDFFQISNKVIKVPNPTFNVNGLST